MSPFGDFFFIKAEIGTLALNEIYTISKSIICFYIFYFKVGDRNRHSFVIDNNIYK